MSEDKKQNEDNQPTPGVETNEKKDGETTKPKKHWCTDRTEEELNTGHAILKGVMDLDPDTIK